MAVDETPELLLHDVRRDAQVMVVRRHPKTGSREMHYLTAGLLPHGTPDPDRALRPVYARSETIAEHPMFSAAFRRRRAIVPLDRIVFPTSGSKSHRRIVVTRRDNAPMACAAVWESFEQPGRPILRTFAIITGPASAELALTADRLPVVIDPDDLPVWLGEVEGDPIELLAPSGSLTARVTKGGPR